MLRHSSIGMCMFFFCIMLSWNGKDWFIQYARWVFYVAYFHFFHMKYTNFDKYCYVGWLSAAEEFFGTLFSSIMKMKQKTISLTLYDNMKVVNKK
jgi:hypothetical protein